VNLTDNDDNQKGRYAFHDGRTYPEKSGDTIYTKRGEPDHMISEACVPSLVLDSRGLYPNDRIIRRSGEVHKEGIDGHTIGQITDLPTN